MWHRRAPASSAAEGRRGPDGVSFLPARPGARRRRRYFPAARCTRRWAERSARAEVEPMPRMVQCVKLGREAEGLEKQPIKGELGKRVFENVSKEAWKMWLEHSKMLVNEFRLDLMSEAGQRIWMGELEKYFFGEGAQLPPDYVAPKAK
jgi:Fe-S cluster biosynthesis and repair protein YggX